MIGYSTRLRHIRNPKGRLPIAEIIVIFNDMYRLCTLLSCCCLLFGCGSPRPYDVRAVVTLDDEPLTEAIVTLIPLRQNAASAFGVTDAEGNVAFLMDEIDGVIPGTYVAVISKKTEENLLTNNEIRALAETGIRYRPNVIELVPEKYTHSQTSDLIIQVGYWHPTTLTFDLRSDNQ